MISGASNLARTFALVASASLHVVALGAGGSGGRSLAASASDARPSAPRSDEDVQIELDGIRDDEPARAPEDHAHDEAALANQARPQAHPYAVPHDHDARPHDPAIDHRVAARSPSAAASQRDDAPRGLGGAGADVAAATTSAATATATAPRTFTLPKLRAGTGGGPTSAPAGVAGEASGGGAGSDGAPIAEAQASVPARRVSGANPSYPERARAAEVEATVDVELVVGVDGGVREARVTRAVGYGLDEAAVAAVKAWRFSPAQRGGANVAVRMRWSVSFELR